MKSTIVSRVFYHIYPLGMCAAPQRNDFSSPAHTGLLELIDRIPHFVSLGVNAVYIGPLFESSSHGYDTVDYCHVDRRLGTNADLGRLVSALHERGIAVILDAVLNHTGRDFFAFRDLQKNGEASQYRDWYSNVDFNGRSPEGDMFMYEGWAGHYSLVKLNTSNSAVRDHLFGAIDFWIREFGIDGLRLDAADVIAPDFLEELSSFCRRLNPEFWLMGEVVFGDYRNWVGNGRLDSVTNYELYKGLWSSFNDSNFHEVAWSLNREFGSEGIYRGLNLYNFVDNHDVNRVASILKNQAHLFPLYGLLFTVPGVPSIYYGSEWGMRGERVDGCDRNLRPAIGGVHDREGFQGLPDACMPSVNSADLESVICSFARIRKEYSALQDGSYSQLHVSSKTFAFLRENSAGQVIVAVNADERRCVLDVGSHLCAGRWKDVLDPSWSCTMTDGKAEIEVHPCWLRIMVRD